MRNMLSNNKQPSIASKTPGFGKMCVFYGSGMQKQWVDSSALFLDWVGEKCGQITKASLIGGELVVTEVDEDLTPKFDTLK